MLRDSTRIWVGSILVEEFTVDEDSTNKEVRMVATDAMEPAQARRLQRRRHSVQRLPNCVDILENIQGKWTLYELPDRAEYRHRNALAWAEDVYSEDDFLGCFGDASNRYNASNH